MTQIAWLCRTTSGNQRQWAGRSPSVCHCRANSGFGAARDRYGDSTLRGKIEIVSLTFNRALASILILKNDIYFPDLIKSRKLLFHKLTDTCKMNIGCIRKCIVPCSKCSKQLRKWRKLITEIPLILAPYYIGDATLGQRRANVFSIMRSYMCCMQPLSVYARQIIILSEIKRIHDRSCLG